MGLEESRSWAGPAPSPTFQTRPETGGAPFKRKLQPSRTFVCLSNLMYPRNIYDLLPSPLQQHHNPRAIDLDFFPTSTTNPMASCLLRLQPVASSLSAGAPWAWAAADRAVVASFLRLRLPPASPLRRLGGRLLRGAHLLHLLRANGAGGHHGDGVGLEGGSREVGAPPMARGRECFGREWRIDVPQTDGPGENVERTPRASAQT